MTTPTIRRIEEPYQQVGRRSGSGNLDLGAYEGRTVIAILDEFIIKDDRNIGVKLRLFDETGLIDKGAYRSVRVASQFNEVGEAIAGQIVAYGKGAVFGPPKNPAKERAATQGMVKALG